MDTKSIGSGMPDPKAVRLISKNDKPIPTGRPPEDKHEKKSGSIEVVATQEGFYGNRRKSPGDKFTIEGEHQMGKWMQKI